MIICTTIFLLCLLYISHIEHVNDRKIPLKNLYDEEYEYDKIIDYNWTLMYDTSTYVCSDIRDWVIVWVPCWYPEHKEHECRINAWLESTYSFRQ